MVTRELIKHEIDQLHEQDLDFLYRIIRALTPTRAQSIETTATSDNSEPWEAFVQRNYGVFRDEPLERGPQGVLEIRETLS
jgi:hypothetical protein